MRELTLYSQSDWREGYLSGSRATDGHKLVNERRRLNEEYEVADSISADWEEEVNSEFADTQTLQDHIRVEVEKPQHAEPDTEKYAVVSGNFSDDVYSATFSFEFSSYNTSETEETGLRLLTGDGCTHELVLTNQAEVFLRTEVGGTYEEKKVEHSATDSVGDIENLISDIDMHDWHYDVQLTEEDGILIVSSRLRSSGYSSVWYKTRLHTEPFTSVEFIQYATDSRIMARKTLNVTEIYVEGFVDGPTYQSRGIDSGEANTLWKNLAVAGVLGVDELEDAYREEDNTLSVELYASNSLKEANRLSDEANQRSFTFEPETDTFELDQPLDEPDDLRGRYLVIRVSPSDSRLYRNELDFVKLEFLRQSDIDEVLDVTSASTSRSIGDGGGVVELYSEQFSASLYFPPDALESWEDIMLTRLGAEEDDLPQGMIGFEFEPDGLQFDKPVLLEVDYSGYPFDAYQSEDGFSLLQLVETDDDRYIRRLDTVLDKENKKALAYIHHFSTYGLALADDLYSPRTQNMAGELPRWMKLRDKDSNWQKVVNHAGALPLDELNSSVMYKMQNQFLGRADTDMRYTSFKAETSTFTRDGEELQAEDAEEVFYKGSELPVAETELDFFTSRRDACYIDRERGLLFFTQPYDIEHLTVLDKGGATYDTEQELVEHHVWNVFDEFGLLMDLERLPGEDNTSYRERIFDTNRNPASATREGLRSHIAREVGIDPDRVEMRALNEDDYIDELTNPDGTASEELKSIVEYVRSYTPIFWDEFRWDEGYWDVVDPEGVGYAYLPTKTDTGQLPASVIARVV